MAVDRPPSNSLHNENYNANDNYRSHDPVSKHFASSSGVSVPCLPGINAFLGPTFTCQLRSSTFKAVE